MWSLIRRAVSAHDASPLCAERLPLGSRRYIPRRWVGALARPVVTLRVAGFGQWLPVASEAIKPQTTPPCNHHAETRINTGLQRGHFTTGFEPLTFFNAINSLHVSSQHRHHPTYRKSPQLAHPCTIYRNYKVTECADRQCQAYVNVYLIPKGQRVLKDALKGSQSDAI
jgi:hypothetical protein